MENPEDACRWEYYLLLTPPRLHLSSLAGQFGRLGQEGWELVASLKQTLVFKRKKRERAMAGLAGAGGTGGRACLLPSLAPGPPSLPDQDELPG